MHAPEEATALEARVRAALAGMGGVAWAYLFGSAAAGGTFRDLDVAVMPAPGPTQRGTWLGGVAASLTPLLGGVSLDLVDLASAAVALRAAVVRSGRLLVDRDPDGRIAWEIDTARRWLDIRPWLERQERLRLERLRARAH
ncbi:MAG: hypothetical protein HY906_12040 [Deltaproteobacteria bacterium]|nr:hypothetical protein [Deltaproteobacteria bacterium]